MDKKKRNEIIILCAVVLAAIIAVVVFLFLNEKKGTEDIEEETSEVTEETSYENETELESIDYEQVLSYERNYEVVKTEENSVDGSVPSVDVIVDEIIEEGVEECPVIDESNDAVRLYLRKNVNWTDASEDSVAGFFSRVIVDIEGVYEGEAVPLQDAFPVQLHNENTCDEYLLCASSEPACHVNGLHAGECTYFEKYIDDEDNPYYGKTVMCRITLKHICVYDEFTDADYAEAIEAVSDDQIGYYESYVRRLVLSKILEKTSINSVSYDLFKGYYEFSGGTSDYDETVENSTELNIKYFAVVNDIAKQLGIEVDGEEYKAAIDEILKENKVANSEMDNDVFLYPETIEDAYETYGEDVFKNSVLFRACLDSISDKIIEACN